MTVSFCRLSRSAAILESFPGREPDDPPISQPLATLDPWRLVWGQPYIDSRTLAAPIEQDLQHEPRPDFRTRLLVRDAALALRGYWGAPRFTQWLAASPVGPRIRAILKGGPGSNRILHHRETTRGQHRLNPAQPDL